MILNIYIVLETKQ